MIYWFTGQPAHGKTVLNGIDPNNPGKRATKG